MELRTLRYFLTVVNEGNMTRAADILHVTQPTLSRQMMDLEEELGTILLIRGKRSLTLTDDGFLFKQQAEEIVGLADKAEHTFLGKKDNVSGVISIGAAEALGGKRLAKYIKEFLDRYPSVQIDLHNEMADSIKDKMEKGLIDIGLLLEPVDTGKYEFLRLTQKETWGILMRKDHPLAEREYLTVEDVKPYSLILPSRPGARRELLNWMGCDENQLKNPVNYNILSNVALLVEAGVGSAICLDGALAVHYSPNTCFKPIFPEHTTRSVLLWKKNHLLHPAASLFIQMIHNHSGFLEE